MTRHGSTVLVEDQEGYPLISIGGVMPTLDEAWAAVERALPTKRWNVELLGNWEDGWEASATGYVLGGKSWSVSTNDSGWIRDFGGHASPASALQALARRLAARSLLENPGGTE